VKQGVALLLLVSSFALKHGIRRDKWYETHQLVVWWCCQLNGQKSYTKLASPRLSPLLWAICWRSSEL